MKYSIGLIAMLLSTGSLKSQYITPGTFVAISNPVKVPFSIYLGVDSTKKIREINYSIFTRVSIPGDKAFSLADKNKDRLVTYKELTDALNQDLFYLSFDINNVELIKYFLFYLDENNDGYLNNEPRISFLDSALIKVESIDHKKYAYDCDAAAYDQNMKIRQTGRCAKDGKLSISELRNASLEKKLWIGKRIYWKY